MARLPIVGGDAGNWGTILNEYLSVEHNSDGTQKNDTSTQRIDVSKSGVAVGTRPQLNFIQGGDTTVTVADDGANNRVNVTISSTAGSTTLGDNTDVTISSPTNGQVLTYNSTGSIWQNQAPAVSSVNGETGAVSLDATDVGADASGSAAAVAASATAFIRYDTGTTSYPARTTATSDANRTVIWIGPTAPTIGSGGAINDVDVWWKTP